MRDQDRGEGRPRIKRMGVMGRMGFMAKKWGQEYEDTDFTKDPSPLISLPIRWGEGNSFRTQTQGSSFVATLGYCLSSFHDFALMK